MAFSIIAFTSAGAAADGDTVTTSPIDTSGATAIFLVVGSHPTGAPGYTISDNQGNGAPTDAGVSHTDTGPNVHVHLWYYVAPVVGAGHTFTVTSTDKLPTIAVLAVIGNHPSSPLDQSAHAGTAGITTSQQPGSVTPSEADELLVMGLVTNAATTTQVIDSGFTIAAFTAQVPSQHFGAGIAYKIQSAAGAENPTWSWTNFCAASGLIATFKSAPTTVTAIPPDAVLASTNLSGTGNIVYGPQAFVVNSDTAIDQFPSAGAPDFARNAPLTNALTVHATNDRVQSADTFGNTWARCTAAGMPTGNQEVQATVYASTSSVDSGQLLVRMATDGTMNGYVASIESGILYIRRLHLSSLTDLASGARTFTTGAHTLRFRATGTNPVLLEAQLDATAILTFSDSDAARKTSGLPGLGIYQFTANLASVDQFQVIDPVVNIADIDEDPDSPDATWATATSAVAATDLRTSFGTPAANPYGSQNFRVQVRKTAGSGSAPTLTAELRQNNVLRTTCFTGQAISSLTGQVLQADWAASDLVTVLNGSDVELRLVSVPGHVLTIGAMPAYAATGQAGAQGNASITSPVLPAKPSTVDSGNLLILQVLHRNDEMDGAGPATITDWIAFPGNPYGGANMARQSLYYRIAGAGEASQTVSVTCTGATAGTDDLVYARIYRFTAADGFAATPIEAISTNAGTTASMAAPDSVTPTGTNRRAVCFGAAASASATIASFTGETAGDWLHGTINNTATGGDGTINVQTADASAGTAIQGGASSFTVTTSAHWNTVGCCLVPATIVGAAESTVEIGAVEWNARSLTPTGPAATPISASDTLRPVVSEASTLASRTSTPETVRPALGEVTSLISRASVIDTARPVVSETASLVSRTSLTETARPILTESASLVSRSQLTDTARPGISEQAAIRVPLSVVDTTRPVLSVETGTVVATGPMAKAGSDTLSPRLTDTSSLAPKLPVSDTTRPVCTEARTLAARASMLETGRPVVSEVSSLVSRSTLTETTRPVLGEAAIVRWALSAADSTRPMLGESASVVATGTIVTAGTDSLTPALGEVASLVIPQALAAADTLTPVLAESASVVATGLIAKAGSDVLRPVLSEASGLIRHEPRAATDALVPILSEGLALVAILQRIAAADTLVVPLIEGPGTITLPEFLPPVGLLHLGAVRLIPVGGVAGLSLRRASGAAVAVRPPAAVAAVNLSPAASAAAVEVSDATVSDPRAL